MSALDRQEGGGHYKDMAIQPVEFIVQNAIPYREANAIKYICRHQKKNGRQDIEKAMHYLEMIRDDYDAGRREREAEGCAAGYPGDSGISHTDKHCDSSPGRWGSPLEGYYTGTGVWKLKKDFTTHF